MKKMITRMLTRQHKCYTSGKRPKNIEKEREDLAVFEKYGLELNTFQRLLRNILPIKDEYVMVYVCLDEMFGPKHPAIQFYYDCRRHLIDFFDIFHHCRRVYWFFQRGSRGWSDRDIWSINYYLCEWLPDALAELKKDKTGTPISCYPEGSEYIDKEDGCPNEIADKIAEEKWALILQMILDGFSAMRRINRDDHPYEAPDRKNFKGQRSYWKAFEKYHDKVQIWEEEQRVIFREGMALFAKHFEDLWD